jgi:hypothetical protein
MKTFAFFLLALVAVSSVSALTYDQWYNAVINRYIDADGYYGNQCWDLAQDYCRRVIGGGCNMATRPSPHAGYAVGVYDSYPVSGEANYFTRLPASAVAQKGDIVIWKYGTRYYPYSHIAVVVADAGAYVDTVSQNSSPAQPRLAGYSSQSSGPSIRQKLTKDGLAGYLRPKMNVFGGGGAPAPAPAPAPSAPRFTRTLSFGMSGNDVAWYQGRLMAKGYNLGVSKPTGYFGANTRTATLAFQRARGIAQVGYCGPQTWATAAA